ncbi:MAG: hypothetical protein WKF70_09020, partial [Chitinophagaceae bacterium]
YGEWTEIAEEYCGVTNAPAYLLVSKLEALGLTPTDIHCLEYLQDRKVLNALPGGFRWLQKNNREHVVLYFETFAQILEDQWLQTIEIPLPVERKTIDPTMMTNDRAYAFSPVSASEKEACFVS